MRSRLLDTGIRNYGETIKSTICITLSQNLGAHLPRNGTNPKVMIESLMDGGGTCGQSINFAQRLQSMSSKNANNIC